jgi:hypothetical protein
LDVYIIDKYEIHRKSRCDVLKTTIASSSA